jgi:hypothetical protein
MFRACATLSNFDFTSEDSSSLKEDEKIKYKKGDFTGLCLIGKSSWKDYNSDVSDDISFESLSSKVVELENALCNQDKLLCKVFRENKRLNLELENSFAEIASLRSMHNNMSAKPCENCNMIMVNYADFWIVHTQVTSQLNGAKLELKELKACSLLLVLVWNVPSLNLSWTHIPSRLKNLRHNCLRSHVFQSPHPLVKFVVLLRVSFFMLPMRTPS